MLIAGLTLIHILVLVYWLGGDLGAFYGAGFLVDADRSVPERAMALTILNNIDMAPRTALILALPTGLLLARAKSWIVVPPYMLLLVCTFHLAWLALAWAVHLQHGGAAAMFRRIDIAIRWAMLVALVCAGVCGVAGVIGLPLFIALKMLVLATAIGLGLLVRRQLVPLFPAAREMFASGPTHATDAAIAGVIAHTRPVVIALWMLLLIAALLGITTPV